MCLDRLEFSVCMYIQNKTRTVTVRHFSMDYLLMRQWLKNNSTGLGDIRIKAFFAS